MRKLIVAVVLFSCCAFLTGFAGSCGMAVGSLIGGADTGGSPSAPAPKPKTKKEICEEQGGYHARVVWQSWGSDGSILDPTVSGECFDLPWGTHRAVIKKKYPNAAILSEQAPTEHASAILGVARDTKNLPESYQALVKHNENTQKQQTVKNRDKLPERERMYLECKEMGGKLVYGDGRWECQ